MNRLFLNNTRITQDTWNFLNQLLGPLSIFSGAVMIYFAQRTWATGGLVVLYIAYNLIITKILQRERLSRGGEFSWLMARCALTSVLIIVLALVSRDPFSFWLFIIVQILGDTFSFEKPTPRIINVCVYAMAVFTGWHLLGMTVAKFQALFLIVLGLTVYAFSITTIHLRRKSSEAEAANRAKGTFLANMSHDIRTPLNAIIGYADLLLENGHVAQGNDFPRRLKNNSDILLSLIDDILDYSKIEAGELSLEKNPCSSAEILDNVDSVARMLVNREVKEIEIRRREDIGLPEYFMGDSLRIHQVLNNFISNAVKFTRRGVIEYGIGRVGEKSLEFLVQDSGSGVPVDRRNEIFEPFRQVDESNRRTERGTGLGLAISKSLAVLMGGDVGIRTPPNNAPGSVFFMNLPYEPTEGPTKTGEQPIDAVRREEKILLVEDNFDNRVLLRRYLEDIGYRVEIAENGLEAVNTFRAMKDLHLILMDIQMPFMDGLEATRRIRTLELEQERESPILIIALTAGAMKADRDKCMEAGCNGYITKPITGHRLRQSLQTYVNG